MDTWRLLTLDTKNAYVNMAIDEAALTANAAQKAPNTLRLYRWNPSAVSIGKFQNPEEQVQLENCRKLGVNVVRRITGGGTVYHDAQDEVTYSLIVKTRDIGVTDIADAYAKVYAGIKDALRILGVTADFNEGDTKNCPNLTVKGRKISGSAQARKTASILQHGTLLLNIDLEKMFTLLKVPWAKNLQEVVQIAERKHTSVRNELGHAVSPETAANALATGFKNALKIELEPGELTAFERKLADRLAKEKYATDAWNLNGKSPIG